MNFRVGHGYDVHKFTKDRPFILGGVEVPYEFGLLGHSDADVLVHAIMDSILGAIGEGDIGKHFPDTDPAYKGASSIHLLTQVKKILDSKGGKISNVDATVVLQKPKIAEFIQRMRENIAFALAVDVSAVNIKATTEEKLGFTGRLEGASAHAVTLVYFQ